MSDNATAQVLAEARVPGLDIPDALSRMGNNPKIYMRIIHSYITTMPGNLEELATSTITTETLPDYSIKIHGAKGSCYGIGANAVGDVAKELEMASKAGDLETCLRNNDAFIAKTRELIIGLEALEARIAELENAAGGKAQAAKPDTALLQTLLAATRIFDIDEMSRLIDDLTSVQYAQDDGIVVKIKDAFAVFDYQTIEETIAAYL